MDSLGSEQEIPLSVEEMEQARFSIEQIFIHIDVSFKITSHRTESYNCVAWALGHKNRSWWPSEDDFWPAGVSQSESIAAFAQMLLTEHFVLCDGERDAKDYDMLALFSRDGLVKHAARRLRSGRWTSKLGSGFDIAHSFLVDLEGKKYGYATTLFCRSRQSKASE